MSVLSPISAADSGGGTPTFLSPPIGCDEAEFPLLLRRYRLGLALFVAAIGMLFVGFSSAYVVRRGIPIYDAGTGGYSTDWEPLRLPIRLLLFNSCLLICASVAMEVVRRKTSAFVYPSETNGREVTLWLSASLLLGTAFLLGQGIAWHALVSSGRFLSTGAHQHACTPRFAWSVGSCRDCELWCANFACSKVRCSGSNRLVPARNDPVVGLSALLLAVRLKAARVP